MDDSTNAPQAGPDLASGPGKSIQFGGWIAIACCLLLVLGPLLVLGFPREVARWYQAAAREADLAGNLDSAREKLDAAVRWAPEDAELYLQRANLRLRQKDLQGSLDDCNRALKIRGDGDVEGLLQRLLTLQRLGQHEQAIADADRIVAEAENALQRADALNTRAYGRALANREIPQGLEDIQAAFEALGTEDNAAFLDTRGYLYYLAGDYPNALRDMERAVQMAEDDRSAFAMQRQGLLQQGVSERLLEDRDQRLKESLAVLYHHRGLVYERLDRADEAKGDFDKAIEFGYSPEDGIW